MTTLIRCFAGLLRFAIEPSKDQLSTALRWLCTAFATHSCSKATLPTLKPLLGAALLLATFATPKGGSAITANPLWGGFQGWPPSNVFGVINVSDLAIISLLTPDDKSRHAKEGWQCGGCENCRKPAHCTHHKTCRTGAIKTPASAGGKA